VKVETQQRGFRGQTEIVRKWLSLGGVDCKGVVVVILKPRERTCKTGSAPRGRKLRDNAYLWQLGETRDKSKPNLKSDQKPGGHVGKRRGKRRRPESAIEK